MRTLPINEELLQYCNDNFTDYDFLSMLFYIVIIMTIIMSLVKTIFPDESVSNSNLTFYLASLTILLILQTLCKDTFALGYFRYSDETKVQLLLAFKSFFIVWIFICYTNAPVLLGMEFENAHEELIKKFN
jgi:hypothetical protein